MINRRVLLVHFHFPPDGLVGGQITAKFAKYLPEFGWEPFVLTAKEQYYTQLDPTTVRDVKRWDLVWRTRRIPHLRYGYLAVKALFAGDSSNEDPNQNPRPRKEKRSRVRRTVSSLLTVPDDLTGWIPPAVVAGLRLVRRNRIDCLFSSGPPWTNHLVAYALKRLTGLPWAACFEDPWTSTKAALRPEDVSAISLGLERRLERAVVSRAEAVICLNDFHRQAMLAQFSDLHPGKFVTIPNGYDQEDFAKLEGTAPTPPMDQFVITHTGSIDYNRTPRQLFLAVRRLIDRGAVSLGQIRLQFIGNCTVAEGQPVHDMAEEYGLGEVVHLSPPIPHAEAIRAMEASHLLLVLAHDWILQVPAKTYQYLRAGRPILALAPEGATADLIKRSGAGVVVHPNDVDGIALCLERYLARFWERRPLLGADPQFVAGFDRRQLTAALSSLLRGLGSSGRTAVQIARETSPEISECPWP